MDNTYSNITKRYGELKTNRDKHVPLWKEISKYVGIRLFPSEGFVQKETEAYELDILKKI